MHALGHTLGFVHTARAEDDILDPNSAHLENTAQYDAASIMTRATNPISWTGFSTQDRAAFREVYPYLEISDEVDVVISPPGDLHIVEGTSRQFTVSCNTEGYLLQNINWSIEQGTISGGSSSVATIVFSQVGKQLIKVTGKITKDGRDPKTFSKQFYAFVREISTPTITCPQPIVNTDQIFTMNYTPVYSNVVYHWSVEGGQVIRQIGNTATIRFSQAGPASASCYVVESQSGFTHTSAIAQSDLTVIGEPVIVCPDSFEEGSGFTRFKLNWDIPDIENYTIEWKFDPACVQYGVFNNDTEANVRSYWPDVYDVNVTVSGNGYWGQVSETFEVTPRPGGAQRMKIFIENQGMPMRITVHGTDIQDKVIEGYGIEEEFASPMTAWGLNRLTVESRSLNGQVLYFERSFNVYIDRDGGILAMVIDENNQDVTNILYSTSPDTSKGYYWELGRTFPY